MTFWNVDILLFGPLLVFIYNHIAVVILKPKSLVRRIPAAAAANPDAALSALNCFPTRPSQPPLHACSPRPDALTRVSIKHKPAFV